MKIRLILLIITLLVLASADAQSFFEGSLQFEVAYTGPQAATLKENEPNTQLTMHLRAGDYIVLLSGGQAPKTFMFVADSNYEYSIDMANQRAYRNSIYSDQNTGPAPKVETAVATGKQLEVAGVLCEEYQLRTAEAVTLFYVNDQYRVDKTLFPPKPRTKASFLVPGLEGRIPLKTIRKQPDLTVTTTCKKITPRTFDPKQFLIPQGYEVKGRDYRY
ncbi:MAG: hypothetical protein SF053_04825 [Bacteroidia bacterium]|jgi:hypothetical protein|nr:hypothetical protein [Bacteroidia bacterium]